jgi:hypothetical protein
MKIKLVILTVVVSWLPSLSWAWGIRGHMSLCEAAAQMVKHPQLAQYLSAKKSRIGYICDVPDLQWRVMSQNFKEHLLRPESLGLSLEQLPVDYSEIMKRFPGKNVLLGSNWWRAEQFYRRAVALRSQFSGPAGLADHAALEFLLNLGFMGHFIGDISQPFHSTQDSDGYGTGHGGIHQYYEEWAVHFISGNLVEKIVLAAQQASQNQDRSFLTEASIINKIKALAVISAQDKKLILSLDPINSPSTKDENGVQSSAHRRSADSAAPLFEPVILTELARSAMLLAQLWDQAYVEVGSPDFSKIKPNALPIIFSFVRPDYF